MGNVAARIILQRISGQASFPDVVPIHPEMVIRESTCPPDPKRVRPKTKPA
jgi:LacI family transcriptional regulator